MISRWVAYAYTCGFLFGWHVHEKASLHFVIPLAIVAAQTLEDAKHYFLLSIGILLRFNAHSFVFQLLMILFFFFAFLFFFLFIL